MGQSIPTFFITDSKLLNEIKYAIKNYPNDADLGRVVRVIINRQEEEIKNRATKG